MKIESFKKSVLGTVIAVLCLIGVQSPLNALAQAQSTPPPPDSSMGTSELPPNIVPSSPLAQVIRLTQAGVDESILLTYVTNSSGPFNLDSDKIIYLKDIGVPNEIVTAMMQRDQQLQQQMAATAYQPPAQPAPAPAAIEPPETAPAPPPMEQPTEITVNNFYDTLAPYGAWVDVEGYGRCWRPSVVAYNPGWQPYCDHGHWVYTDSGWYWFSDYSWGWAPFHYGRWFQHSRWGWCWAPDTVWGPSWVTWRYSNDYCGWAPLPPFAVYREGVGFFYQGRNVGVGFDFGLSVNCFTFVPIGRFCDPHPRRFRAATTQVTQIYNHTTVINNFKVHNHNFVNGGIAPEHITAVTRMPIRPIAIRETISAAGHGPHGDQLSHDGGTLIVNRPVLTGNPASGGNRNNRPAQSGSPAPNHSPQPNNNWPGVQTRPVGPLGQPQERYHPSVPNQNQTQRPLPSANYHSSPPPVATAPNDNHQTVSPPGWEQQSSGTPHSNPHNPETPVVTPTPSQGQHNAPEASHHNQNQTQRPPPPARYDSSPPPPATAPNYDSRTISPRLREQQPSGMPHGNTYHPEAPVVVPVPSQGQHNASEAGHYNAPASAPVERPQRSQPSSQSSSGPASQNSNNQNGSGNGPRH